MVSSQCHNCSSVSFHILNLKFHIGSRSTIHYQPILKFLLVLLLQFCSYQRNQDQRKTCSSTSMRNWNGTQLPCVSLAVLRLVSWWAIRYIDIKEDWRRWRNIPLLPSFLKGACLVLLPRMLCDIKTYMGCSWRKSGMCISAVDWAWEFCLPNFPLLNRLEL